MKNEKIEHSQSFYTKADFEDATYYNENVIILYNSEEKKYGMTYFSDKEGCYQIISWYDSLELALNKGKFHIDMRDGKAPNPLAFLDDYSLAQQSSEATLKDIKKYYIKNIFTASLCGTNTDGEYQAGEWIEAEDCNDHNDYNHYNGGCQYEGYLDYLQRECDWPDAEYCEGENYPDDIKAIHNDAGRLVHYGEGYYLLVNLR